MYNKSFNLTEFVKDIPSLAVRKACWLSLVGSVNASLFGAADGIAQKLEAEGMLPAEFKTLSKRDVIALCSGPETGASRDSIKAAKRLYQVHAEWRPLLLKATVVSSGKKADDTLGSIASTLVMMTGPQRARDIAVDAIPLLASLGITVTQAEIDTAKKQRVADDNFWATQRRQRVGMTEWIIDNLFASNDIAFDDEQDEAFSQLDIDIKEFLANKLMTSLSKQMSSAVQNTLFGRKGDNVLGVGDYLIIQKLLPTLIDAMSKTSAKKVIAKAKAPRVAKPKVAKPKVQRAPAPVTPTTVVSEVNGIKVTTAA